MGVYIKGMKMPETKYDCDFWNTDHICTANPKATVCDPANGIYPPEDCPLVEIPEPHKKLVEFIEVATIDEEDSGTEVINLGSVFEAYMKMREAKTVIEAEE